MRPVKPGGKELLLVRPYGKPGKTLFLGIALLEPAAGLLELGLEYLLYDIYGLHPHLGHLPSMIAQPSSGQSPFFILVWRI